MALIVGFALAHAVAISQVGATSPGFGPETAPLLTRGD